MRQAAKSGDTNQSNHLPSPRIRLLSPHGYNHHDNQREPLREIIAKRKPIEYREIKAYWTTRLQSAETPFLLRLINGMTANAPEVTVVVTKVRKNSRRGCYELHLGQIREVKNWDREREQPVT